MRATVFRGIIFGFSVFVVAALFWSVARAEVLTAQVRITGDDLPVKIVFEESSQPPGFWLGENAFTLESHDDGTYSGTRTIQTGGGEKTEQVTIFGEEILLAQFKANPEGAATRMGFVNASEARCPSESNALLLWTRARGPNLQNFGNCLELKKAAN